MTVNSEQSHPRSQLTRPNAMFGMERYFEFLEFQADLAREIAVTWAAAVNSMSGAAFGQAQTAGHVVTQLADHVDERALAVEHVAHSSAEHAERVAKTPHRRAELQPRAHTRGQRREPAVGQVKRLPTDEAARQNLLATDAFDEVVELLVYADIAATTQLVNSR